MPSRHGIVALVFGLILVVSTIGWAVYQTGYLRGEQSGEYKANSDTYSRHAKQQIERSCGDREGSAFAECVVDVIEATNENERAERDLKAQKDMARWSLWMLVVTSLMAIVTAFGVYYVWRTLLATQKMAEDTREIGEKQIRAYLTIVSGKFWLDEKGDIRVAISIQNSGQSPALDVRVTTSRFCSAAEWNEVQSKILSKEASFNETTSAQTPFLPDIPASATYAHEFPIQQVSLGDFEELGWEHLCFMARISYSLVVGGHASNLQLLQAHIYALPTYRSPADFHIIPVGNKKAR